MKRALLPPLVALVAACALVAAVSDAHGVRLTLTILLPIGAVALLIAFAADTGRLPLPSLRDRFQLGVGLALGQLLAAVVICAGVMFVSADDAWTAIAVLIFAAVVAACAAQVLLRGVLGDVTAIGAGLRAVGRGQRDIEIAASSSRELADLARSANQMIQALEREERSRDAADAARRHVIVAVSHDLRTPLASLQLLTQALEDDLVDAATAREYVKTMGANVRALATLVDDLFELSRLNAGDFAWSTEAVQLPGLLDELLHTMRAQADARGVAVRAEVQPGLAPARANPDKLARVLANLLQNAIHHTPPDGSVYVRANQSGDAAEIEVADTGAGISAEDRSRVFDAFYRGGDSASRTTAGSGLGLAIARAIVEAHGGRIWLAEAEHGTRVRFTVPLAT
jgi:signal transduction histidine kinase